jgi:S1-C subfamily serine protease
MRKILGLLLVFIVGIACGAWILKGNSLLRGYSASADKSEVLKILDQNPIQVDIPDNPLVKAAAIIEPAVVNIDVVGERTAQGVDIFGFPFEQSYLLQGKGSGVIISPDGYIVTNNHVIEGTNTIRITMTNGKKFDGRVIGADPSADLAVVKIDGRNLPAAQLGDSSKLKVGEYVIAIGNPLGIGTTVTHGIISATNRKNLVVGEGRILKQALQTDAPINRGNSGGALANVAGQLIGINTAIASEKGGGNIGIGFAIPIDAARDILKQLIETGRASASAPAHPFIGIVYQPLPPQLSAQWHLKPGNGVLVAEVRPLTPAEDAGIHVGDIILAIDGIIVNNQNVVRMAISKRHVGDHIEIRILHRNGTEAMVAVKLGMAPVNNP